VHIIDHGDPRQGRPRRLELDHDRCGRARADQLPRPRERLSGQPEGRPLLERHLLVGDQRDARLGRHRRVHVDRDRLRRTRPRQLRGPADEARPAQGRPLLECRVLGGGDVDSGHGREYLGNLGRRRSRRARARQLLALQPDERRSGARPLLERLLHSVLPAPLTWAWVIPHRPSGPANRGGGRARSRGRRADDEAEHPEDPVNDHERTDGQEANEHSTENADLIGCGHNEPDINADRVVCLRRGQSRACLSRTRLPSRRRQRRIARQPSTRVSSPGALRAPRVSCRGRAPFRSGFGRSS